MSKKGSACRPWPVASAVTTFAERYERGVGGGQMIRAPHGWQVDDSREALAVGADPSVAVEDDEASFAPGCAGAAGAFLARSFAAERAAGAAVAGVDLSVCEVVGRHGLVRGAATRHRGAARAADRHKHG